ncbi:hypothetical protein [Dyadobacter frigoris]|uniref:Uncharacterized protein n=1 Tax=Dyadobacter frigoris TaxID=2576211 RepID=A0A4U6CW65_9BACT|nr:hypothetical protein [Dyadobacter frigoris]TKT88536.1 hypothetical protein FDK13_26665 [Dyadobacter frigoris]GLU54584.1 hypothetical protein Dfri01_40450 [Dyadobacter frigoris]
MNKSDSINGMVLFSISLPKQSNGNYYIDIFHIESRKKEKLLIRTTEVPNLKNSEMKIYYGAKVLPKGEYKIYGFGKIFNDGTVESGYSSRGNFAIPFTVFGGDVNYVGDYFGVFKRVTNGGGLKVPTEAYFIVSNRYQEDKEIIREKFTGLDLNHVVDAMPDFTGNNSSYSGMYLKGINVP